MARAKKLPDFAAGEKTYKNKIELIIMSTKNIMCATKIIIFCLESYYKNNSRPFLSTGGK